MGLLVGKFGFVRLYNLFNYISYVMLRMVIPWYNLTTEYFSLKFLKFLIGLIKVELHCSEESRNDFGGS